MLNYSEIISVGIDYIDARNRFSRAYPHGVFISHGNPDAYDKYRYAEKHERALVAVALVTGIPSTVIVNAARIYNRYYERGGDKLIDECRLVTALAANAA